MTSKYKEKKLFYKQVLSELSCQFCNESNPNCLHFHHLDPKTKTDTVERIARRYHPKRVLEEIAKCCVLCASCHLKLHYLIPVDISKFQCYLKEYEQ